MGAALVMLMMAIIPYAGLCGWCHDFVVTEGDSESQTNDVLTSQPRAHGWLCRHDGYGRGLRLKILKESCAY